MEQWTKSLEKRRLERESMAKARKERARKLASRRNDKSKVLRAQKKKTEELREFMKSNKYPHEFRPKQKRMKNEKPKAPETLLRGRPRRPDGGWYGNARKEEEDPKVQGRGENALQEDAQEEAQENALLEEYGKRGISTYTTTDGLPVMFLHYTACERKDPANQKGAEWIAHEANAYPGGVEGPRWLQEMEIRFDVRDTARVWPDFDDMRKWISCPDFDIRPHEHVPLIAGYDYGYLEPSAIVVLALFSEEEIYLIDEIYVKETSIADQAALLKTKPYFHRISEFWGDPAIWARTQHQGTITTSMGQIWEDEHDITWQKGQNFVGSDAAFIHLLNGSLWERGNCKFKIFESCKNALRELRTLSWREQSENQNLPVKEAIASKNVHAFDALKYALLERYQGKRIAELPAAIGSVDWYIEEMTRVREEVRYVLIPGV